MIALLDSSVEISSGEIKLNNWGIRVAYDSDDNNSLT